MHIKRTQYTLIHSEKTSIFDKEIKSTKIKQSEKKDMTESNAK